MHQFLKEIFCRDLMEPIIIILLNPIIKTYCTVSAAHGREQYLGMAQASTSKDSFCSHWQQTEQSLLAPRSGRRPNYKYVYTVISLPPVWLNIVYSCSTPAHSHWIQLGSGRTMHSVSSSSRPVRRGHRAAEETLNDVNNVLLKSSTEGEISGMHDVSAHHYATMLR